MRKAVAYYNHVRAHVRERAGAAHANTAATSGDDDGSAFE